MAWRLGVGGTPPGQEWALGPGGGLPGRGLPLWGTLEGLGRGETSLEGEGSRIHLHLKDTL